MNIAEIVKECALKAYDASIPCDVVFGVVEGVEPVKIRVGEMLLEGDLLLVAQSLLYKECEVKMGIYERTIVIQEGLQEKDKVALLRKSGGGEYIAFAKI